MPDYPIDSCGLWVAGEERFHRRGEIIVFDDSKMHKAFNISGEYRVVLIVDFLRPEGIPLGTASGGNTKELAELMSSFAD
jgi:aspartyl/asparaginyl beta-hydroxylase (cupin superfamily)